MRAFILIIGLTLSACQTPVLVEHEGPVANVRTPQAAEQCEAQPELDWCHARR